MAVLPVWPLARASDATSFHLDVGSCLQSRLTSSHRVQGVLGEGLNKNSEAGKIYHLKYFLILGWRLELPQFWECHRVGVI